MFLLLFLTFLLNVAANPSFADPQRTVLPEIVVEGSAADLLQFDPIVPSQKEKPTTASGSGSLVRDFSDRIPLPVTDTGTPGGFSQFRGIGRTVDETNVQTLGVPLNQALGGGLDHSSFPQYLWSSYRYQLGTVQGAYDPRATSGTLTLVPWTAEAIERGELRGRFSQLFARDLFQGSVAGAGSGFAGLVGYSADFSKGISGSASGRILRSKNTPGLDVRAHFLATDVKSKSPGPITFPTPDDTQAFQRYIPVLEIHSRTSAANRQKLTLFYDLSKSVHAGSYPTDDRTKQWGAEGAWIVGSYRLGLSGRHVDFRRFAGGDISRIENYFHFSSSKAFEAGSWLIEPIFQGDSMTGQPFFPGAGLGARNDLDASSALFARAQFAPRFATIQDRYYTAPAFAPFPGFMGNPDVEPEKNATFLLGYERKGDSVRAIFEFYAQFKKDIQLKTASSTPGIDTVENVGDGRISSFRNDLGWEMSRRLRVVNSLNLAHSLIQPGARPVPYLAPLIDSLRLEWHGAQQVAPQSEPPRNGSEERWNAAMIWRGVSDATDQSGKFFGGYSLVNLEGRYRLLDLRKELGGGVVDLALRFENVFDRRVEVTRDYPLIGRVFSFLVTAQL